MLNLDESAAVQSPQDQIIYALRAELLEYGGLLNLFDQQEEAILNQKPATVTEVALRLEAQLATVRARSFRRKGLVSALTPNAGAWPALFRTMPCFPLAMRPLLEALLTEVNRLIAKVRRRAQQNQMLLARELHELLNPVGVIRAYAPATVASKARGLPLH
jgi:signal transduction histidine kinase